MENKEIQNIKKKIAEIKKEEDKIFSRAEYEHQQKLERKMKNTMPMIILGIALGIVGLVFGVKMYNAGGSPFTVIYMPVLGAAAGAFIGFIIKLITKAILQKKFKPVELEKYRKLENQIAELQTDIKEVEAVGNRANKLFVGVVQTGITSFNTFEYDIVIDGVSYGEIRGVSEIELEPGRHVIGGKFGCTYTGTNNQFFTIHKVLPSTVINVSEKGSFVYMGINIPSYNEGKYLFHFGEVSSKDFNELVKPLKTNKYY